MNVYTKLSFFNKRNEGRNKNYSPIAMLRGSLEIKYPLLPELSLF